MGELLTGVQAVVAVGILHLRHRAREGPVRPPPLGGRHFHCRHTQRAPHSGKAPLSPCALAHTQPGVRGHLNDSPETWHGLGRANASPVYDLFRPYSTPVPRSPDSRAHASFVSPPWHTRGESCLLCSPGARRAWGTLGTGGKPLVFRPPYVHEPDPPSPRWRARPRGLP